MTYTDFNLLWRFPSEQRHEVVLSEGHGWLACVWHEGSEGACVEVRELATGTLLQAVQLDSAWANSVCRVTPFDGGFTALTAQSLYIWDAKPLRCRRIPLREPRFFADHLVIDGLVHLVGPRQWSERVPEIAVYELSSGSHVRSREFPQYFYSGGGIRRVDGKACLLFSNLGGFLEWQCRNNMGAEGASAWACQWVLFLSADGAELADSTLESEPVLAEIRREVDRKGVSRYRVSVPGDMPFVDFALQMEVGAESCLHFHAYRDGVSTVHPDEDFGGKIVLDLGTRSLSDEQFAFMQAMAERHNERADLFDWIDAVRGKPVQFCLESGGLA